MPSYTQIPLIPGEDMEPVSKDVSLEDLPLDSEIVCPAPDRKLITSMRIHRTLIYPIVLSVQPDGSYKIWDGRRRVKAARRLDWATIPARIWPFGWQDGAAVVFTTNRQRSDNLLAELQEFDRLVSQGYDHTTIQTSLLLDAATLKQIAALSSLPPVLKQGLLDGRIAPGVALQVVKLPEYWDQLIQVFEEEEKLTAKQVKAVKQVKASALVDAVADQLFGDDEPTQASDRGWAIASYELERVIRQVKISFPESEQALIKLQQELGYGYSAQKQKA